MRAFIKELELISLVNNNYDHIQQLETLEKHYSMMKESDYSKQNPSEYGLTQEQIDKLLIIIKTTHNSHYSNKFYTSSEFQNEQNIVDNVLKTFNLKPLKSFKQMYYNAQSR